MYQQHSFDMDYGMFHHILAQKALVSERHFCEDRQWQIKDRACRALLVWRIQQCREENPPLSRFLIAGSLYIRHFVVGARKNHRSYQTIPWWMSECFQSPYEDRACRVLFVIKYHQRQKEKSTLRRLLLAGSLYIRYSKVVARRNLQSSHTILCRRLEQ